ncbi:hypothetical protein [Bradyrhizobium betae]|uniref:Uncharacterized protein n=1 Tax=Bradyrhizobium betae TaxID=244734 RepID=A0A5P6NZI8_9BRAD|nr:hypothetical protein [Bradyrhizobium betae]MCS3725471.1 hypothetical protein [Bradyrhizobium betae]QFI71238.1 hypothetical protein F8237_01920 [Bradyrhizobium betae]
MNGAALWFFILSLQAMPFEASRLGPLTKDQCVALQQALPGVDGKCVKLVGVKTCNSYGAGGSVCPILEGEMVR